jgi:membrane AbrB-like protein
MPAAPTAPQKKTIVLSNVRNARQFVETMLIAFAGGMLFDYVRFPAGWMAGSLVFVAIAALSGRKIYMPASLARIFFIVLGIVIGGVATPETVQGMTTWPLSIVIIAVAMLVVTALGAAYLRMVHGWDAQTALFAAVPGALSQVSAMAAERDADLRGIVIVQTVRVVVLAVGVPAGLALLGVSALARLPAGSLSAFDAPLQFLALVGGAAVAALGLFRIGFTGGFFFGPMVVSAVLHGGGLIDLNLPQWLATLAMLGLGAINGSRFNDTSFRLLLGYLSASLGVLVVVLAACAVFVLIASWALSLPVANLVASYAPGSVDVMMILALALHLDPVFVGAHHLARILVVSSLLPVAVRLTEVRAHKARKLPSSLETARETLED